MRTARTSLLVLLWAVLLILAFADGVFFLMSDSSSPYTGQADDRVAVQRVFLGGVLPLLLLAVLFTWREVRGVRRRNGRPADAGRRSRRRDEPPGTRGRVVRLRRRGRAC